MENKRTFDVLNYPVYIDELDNISLHEKTVINTINQYSYCIAEEDIEFKNALSASDVLLPDGIGITAAALLRYKRKIKKIAGADVHKFLLEKLNKTYGKCFYLGSSESTLKKIKARILLEYPNIHIGTYSPPYKAIFTPEDCFEMIQVANLFNPDVLFVGMTAPKQEKWTKIYQHKLNANVICSVGAVFDFYAGTVERPSKIWINLGLEWFVRFLKEPKRMWKRYFYYGPMFVYSILTAKK